MICLPKNQDRVAALPCPTESFAPDPNYWIVVSVNLDVRRCKPPSQSCLGFFYNITTNLTRNSLIPSHGTTKYILNKKKSSNCFFFGTTNLNLYLCFFVAMSTIKSFNVASCRYESTPSAEHLSYTLNESHIMQKKDNPYNNILTYISLF
jgi:hypothetical protein